MASVWHGLLRRLISEKPVTVGYGMVWCIPRTTIVVPYNVRQPTKAQLLFSAICHTPLYFFVLASPLTAEESPTYLGALAQQSPWAPSYCSQKTSLCLLLFYTIRKIWFSLQIDCFLVWWWWSGVNHLKASLSLPSSSLIPFYHQFPTSQKCCFAQNFYQD